jgi:hypothetical protein
MALTLTARGQDEFIAAIQSRIAQAQLVDADGNQIEGWNYEPRAVDPEAWEGTQYEPGFNWIFVSTDVGTTPVVIAGLAWANEVGDRLAIEPLTEPFVVNRTGQTLAVEPVLRLFGAIGLQESA